MKLKRIPRREVNARKTLPKGVSRENAISWAASTDTKQTRKENMTHSKLFPLRILVDPAQDSPAPVSVYSPTQESLDQFSVDRAALDGKPHESYVVETGDAWIPTLHHIKRQFPERVVNAPIVWVQDRAHNRVDEGISCSTVPGLDVADAMLSGTVVENPPAATVTDPGPAVESMEQNVNHPKRYNKGKIECIDALESAVAGKSPEDAICVANVIKYLWRYEEKEPLRSLKSAEWYLKRLIAKYEAYDADNG